MTIMFGRQGDWNCLVSGRCLKLQLMDGFTQSYMYKIVSRDVVTHRPEHTGEAADNCCMSPLETAVNQPFLPASLR